MKVSTATIDDLEAPPFSEQLQRLGINASLVERVNLMLGSLNWQQDNRRYNELVFVLSYILAQHHNTPNRTELACRKIQDYVEWKYPDLYGFLHNPSQYGYIKSSHKRKPLLLTQ